MSYFRHGRMYDGRDIFSPRCFSRNSLLWAASDSWRIAPPLRLVLLQQRLYHEVTSHYRRILFSISVVSFNMIFSIIISPPVGNIGADTFDRGCIP